MKEYTVLKCAGKEYGIFSKTANCFVAHWDTKKEAQEHCDELNAEHTKSNQYDYYHE